MILYKLFQLNFINILGYGAQPTGYGEEDSFPDLTPFLALSLVILGLSLLFPAIITITDINSNTNNNNVTESLGRSSSGHTSSAWPRRVARSVNNPPR